MSKVKGISNSVTPSQESLPPKRKSSQNIPDYIWEEAKKELRLVKGRFRVYNKEEKGDTKPICFRKYPEEICPMFKMTMKDGEVYEVPLYIARYINGFDSNAKALNGNVHSCQIPKHGYKMSNPNDLKSIQDAGIVDHEKIIAFESLEFGTELE